MVSTPSPPDPYETADAQGQANRDAAIASSVVNNMNEVSPYGNVTYSLSGYETDGSGNKNPRYTRTVELNDAQQTMLDQQNALGIDLNSLAQGQVRGGARPGAGRPKGELNKKHEAIIAAVVKDGVTPVEYMLSVMRDKNADAKDRAWAAEKAAPYIHPRPAPTANRIEIELPDTSTIDGIKDAMAAITKAVSTGNVAPSEAQGIVSILEAQRKAIEAGEILERLEVLERNVASN